MGSPKLHTNDDGSMIRRGSVEQVMKYQIEYYFGDKNYFKDSFLQAFKTDGNPEGYVPTVELLRFSKMKASIFFYDIFQRMTRFPLNIYFLFFFPITYP